MSDAEVIGQAAALLLCLGGMGGVLCRQDLLKAATHRAPVVGLHVALCVACGLGVIDAAQGLAGAFAGQPAEASADFGDAAAAIGTLFWLWLSWFTWAGGPPKHTTKQRPAPQADPHTNMEAL